MSDRPAAARIGAAEWRRIFTVLDEILELPAGERQERLDRLRRLDPTLVARIEDLLDSEARSGVLDTPAAVHLAALLQRQRRR